MSYYPIIGLEVHVELSTKSKMFCSCSANHFSIAPNTQVCPVCLGLPGALPFANKEAIERCVKLGLAFNCAVSTNSKFDRKHYFYPDLPKAYQISQYDMPLCTNGSWGEGSSKVTIRRIHMEEDTAKMVHKEVDGHKVSLVDFNRSGVPLVELVTEPDFHDSASVVAFLKELQKIVRYLAISDADMEKGSMRLEANISLAAIPKGEWDGTLPDFKVELKNINSFRFLGSAIDAEVVRQTQLLKSGKTVAQETRGYNEDSGLTFPQRSKEEAHDYRYFPEPDIPPIHFSTGAIEALQASIPELPSHKASRYVANFKIRDSYAAYLTETADRAAMFEEAVALGHGHGLEPQDIASAFVNAKADDKYGTAAKIIEFLVSVKSRSFASGAEIDAAVATVVAQEVKAVADFKAGKEQVIGFLMGCVQKVLQGTGESAKVRESLLDRLR